MNKETGNNIREYGAPQMEIIDLSAVVSIACDEETTTLSGDTTQGAEYNPCTTDFS